MGYFEGFVKRVGEKVCAGDGAGKFVEMEGAGRPREDFDIDFVG